HRCSPAHRDAAGEEGLVMDSSLRRGLPRVPGGEAWPPEGTPAPPTDFIVQSAAAAPADPAPEAPAAQAEPEAPAPTAQAPAASPAAVGPAFRRGLPRVAGGEPWPPAAAAPAGAAAAVSTPAPAAAEPAEPIE